MSSDPADFDTLLHRLAELGHRDRKAVFRRLGPEDRARVGIAIAARAEAQRRDADRVRRAGRQFAGYSAWLSPFVQTACAPSAGTSGEMAPAARQAIADIHRALCAEDTDQSEGPLASIRRWASSILGPGEATRS